MARKMQFMEVRDLDIFEMLENLSPGPIYIYTYIPDGDRSFVLISGVELDPDDEESILEEQYANFLEETGDDYDYRTDY